MIALTNNRRDFYRIGELRINVKNKDKLKREYFTGNNAFKIESKGR